MIKQDIEDIKNYYQDIDNLLIVGLGDDRGVNFEKNLLILLKETLSSTNYNIETIDAFSMLYNKNRHIDYYLKHNISTEQLKLLQKYGTKNEITHALGNNYLGSLIGIIGSNMIKSANEENLYLSDEIKNNKKPIIVYSSGINDIMYNLEMNPFTIKGKYYNAKNAYDYSLSLISGENREKNLIKLMDSHKSNFENILGINNDAKICALGAYLYYKRELYNEPFQEFVLSYNDYLKQLCKEYKLTYVGTRSIEKTDYQRATNTYFSKVTYHIASRILKELAYNINNTNKRVNPITYDNAKMVGVLYEMKQYQKNLLHNDPDKYIKVEDELKREESVCRKILIKN